MEVPVAGEIVGGPMDGAQVMFLFEVPDQWCIGEGSRVQIGTRLYELENFDRDGSKTKLVYCPHEL
jgi:hypothetical protein